MTADLREQLQATLGGSYTLERELGGGGMARVFLAEETALGRRVVVKVLAPDLVQELSAERFAREIRVSARLQHPNIVPVLATGVADGVPYYTMPYVDGESLRARLARLAPGDAVPMAEAVSVLRDVVRALAYAHERGVVHRDVKPENVLLAHDAAVVADFGIAKALDAARAGSAALTGGTALTQLGAAVGTPAYMAPEQAAGDPAVDHRADVYAWGVLAYEVLAGAHPFDGKRSAHALIAAHLAETPAPLGNRRFGLPPVLAGLVMRCLAKDPADRPADTRELANALGGLAHASTLTLASPVPARPGTREAAAALSAVAVLPLVNTTGDAENEHFSDGLTDELIGALSQVDSLAVTGRTSSFALKGKGLSAREIADTLHVATVLEGSVRRAGDRLKVRVQLVNADGSVLWSDAYNRLLTDVFAVQEEIAQAVVRSLEVHLSAARGPLVRPSTADLTAYDLYLKGTFLRRRLTTEDLRRAVGCFEQAVARDPSYARAYAALSHTHFLIAVLGGGPTSEEVPRARAYAAKALALDPSRAEGHWALAQVLFVSDWDWAAAAAEFEAALALDPGSVDARHLYAIFLLCQSRFAAAEAELERSLTAEPLLPELHNTLGRVYLGARQPDRAIRSFREALALSPAFYYARAGVGHAYLQQGRCGEALAEFQGAAATGGASGAAQLAYAYAVCGRRAEATTVLRALLAPGDGAHVPPFQIAMAYAGLGDADAAFAWLERACAERDLHVAGLNVFPAFDPLRTDARFARLVGRMGLVP